MASQKQSYRAGEAKGQAEEKTRQTKDDTATAKDKATQMGRSTKETTEAGKEKTGGGVIQRTSEQVKNMAQGAAEKVKLDTFGMAGNGEDDDDEINL
uniref:late embryogenesis abundant protein Dc3-like n=1 Tax=Erigeron canadensis TaxID=72917 RepID=UPI001CB9A2F5|nr:late embryogenesis abundant protein Dc3-like [Erigeron canadensis]